MRIAIIGGNGPDTMEHHLNDAFIHAGHDSQIFDIYDYWYFNKSGLKKIITTLDKIARAYSDKYDVNVFNRVASRVLEYNPALVVCVYRFIHPSFVSTMKCAGKTVIHVNPDQMTTLEYQQVFASDYDAWFTKDPYMERFMRNNMKLNVFHYDEAFNIRSHKRPNEAKKECEADINIDVMTYGTLYPYRSRMLKQLLEAGIDLKLYGVAPNRFYNGEMERSYQHKYITGEEKAKLLYGSKIVFNNMHFAEVEGVNCRFFEVNGAGAFQLSDYRPILNNILPVDPELVSFRSIDEGIDKIKYYLHHPEERYEIADKIYQHFIQNYTYDHLIKKILNNIF